MRIRSTKPEFWRSKTIAQLEWEDRFVLKGLESYVDDNGVGKDDLALIAADVFPRDLSADPSRTLARLSEAISRIHKADLIARYTVDDEKLLYIDKWKDIQRIDKPGRGRFPRPDGTTEYSQDVNRESYRNSRGTLASPPETLAPGTGEQGNRGTGEQTTTTDARNDEPPTDEPPAEVVVDVEPPEHIDNAAQPTKARPSSAARTVVGQVLGNVGYPRTTIDRLAVQVGKLARQHPDALIRQALTEWDRRPDCGKPEFLPTVLGDLVKASRVAPHNGVTPGEAKVLAWAELGNPDQPERKAIGQ